MSNSLYQRLLTLIQNRVEPIDNHISMQSDIVKGMGGSLTTVLEIVVNNNPIASLHEDGSIHGSRLLAGIIISLWEGDQILKANKKDVAKIDKLRQQLCTQHDALASAIADCGPTRNTRELRNAMGDLSNTVEAIANFTGSVSLEALPANFTTISRYIP